MPSRQSLSLSESLHSETSQSPIRPREINAFQLRRTPTAESTSSSRLSRQSSNLSELSRIITGIRDDQQILGGLNYNKSADIDYVLANELDRVTSKITSRRQSISVGLEPHPHGDDEEEPEEKSEEVEEEGKYKADGAMAWIMAICAMMNIFATWGGSAAFGVFLNFYTSSNTFPEATKYDYALVGGLIVFLANFLSPISALLYKVFGFRAVCLAGVIIQTAGWILASFAKRIWHLYLTQGVLVGISFLLIFIPSTLVIPTWFVKQKAASMGLTMSGTGLGGLVFSLSINKVIQDTGDQRWALRMVGLVGLFLVLTSALVMRPRNYKQPPLKTTLSRPFLAANAKVIFDFSVAHNPGVRLIAIWFTLVIVGYTLMTFSMSAYATAIGLSHYQATTLTAAMNAAQTVGRPCMGFIADYFGRANFLAVCSLVISILLYAYWTNAKSFGSLVGFAILIGLLIGVGASLAQPLAADAISPNMEQLPAAWSAINIFMCWFSLVAEVIALSLVVQGAKNPYYHTQIFAGTCFIVCFLTMLTLREFLIRKMLKERSAVMQQKLAGIVGTTKSGYLKAEDDEGDDELDADEEAVLRARVERYNNLLRGSVVSYFIRMVYPIRA
ncbi:putative transporter ESBP6 [Candida viswanathii]|uniref:Putative transporter ESBP6 n=1 Tax=Candida viswanathii TaxID=5486 RepID=A0A367YG17_9ASCO|nr:putative transporter ESBP6 [Candida viswanathii]